MYLYTIYKKFLILIKVKKYSISTSFTHFLTKNPVGTRVCWGNQRTKNACCHACRNASFSEKITKFAIAMAVLTMWDSVKKSALVHGCRYYYLLCCWNTNRLDQLQLLFSSCSKNPYNPWGKPLLNPLEKTRKLSAAYCGSFKKRTIACSAI